MNNVVFGTCIFVLCSLVYYYSWKFHSKNNFRLSIILLIIGGLVLRIYAASDFYLHQWDESFHALVSKNLIHHPFLFTLYDNPVLPYDYKSWTTNHIWLHKPPLPLWAMASSIWIFGVNEFAVRFPSVILSAIRIWLTYEIARYFFNRRIAFLSSFLFSIHGLIIAAATGRIGQDHIDTFFLFFTELAVFFSIRFVQKEKIIYTFLAGVSIGAAILSKWMPALIVLPIWFLIMVHSKKFTKKSILFHFLLLTGICTIVFLPWQIYIFQMFPLEANWEMNSYKKHITEVLEGHGGLFYYYFDWLRIIYGDLVYLPVIWFLWKTFRHLKNYPLLIFTIWFLIPYIFFSLAKTKTINYTLFTSPAIFIITSVFWHYLYFFRKKIKYKWLVYSILFLLIALPIRYTTERIRCFEVRETNPQWAKELREFSNNIHSDSIVMFNIKRPIETMFYTHATAYTTIPQKTEIEKIMQKGYIIYLNDDGKLDESIKGIHGINIIKFTE